MPVDITNTPIVPDDSLYGSTVVAEPRQQYNIGVNTNNAFFDAVTYKATNGLLDMSAFDEFTTASRNRDQYYSLIDMMGEDPTISAVLEIYVDDSTEPNENGDIVWAVSDDPNIEKYITFLLKSFGANKKVGKWVECLCKYGDVYLKLLRKSEYENDGLFGTATRSNTTTKEDDWTPSQGLFDGLDFEGLDDDREVLDEQVNMKIYSKQDPYVYHLEMMTNPAEMFELTKYDESYAFIQANVNSLNNNPQRVEDFMETPGFARYRFKRSDVNVYQATEFVHGYLDSDISRIDEEVQIFLTSADADPDEVKSATYKVRRGRSLFRGSFKAWRELQLLQDSVLLNRVTKSSVVRAIGVEVGDMPKEMVQPHLQGVKSLMEQKSSINTGRGYSSYTNPGPVENNVYIPTRNGVGSLSVQQIGGDVDVGQLTDLDYFRDTLFGALRVPKQYLNILNDNAGFSGGESLAQISARYAKTLVRIQNTIIQMLTDAVNIILASKGLNGYINKYKLRMTTPVTQNDIDKRENITSKVQQTSDIMNLLQDIDSRATKFKILKSLMSSYITNPEVMTLLQDYINKLEEEEANGGLGEESFGGEEGFGGFGGGMGGAPIENSDFGFTGGEEPMGGEFGGEAPVGGGEFEETPAGAEETTPTETSAVEATEAGEEEPLPTPEDLGMDFTQNENFE